MFSLYEMKADEYCELQKLLKEEAIDEINWAFIEAFEENK